MIDNPILMAAAVIPAIVLLVKVYKADRVEKEPLSLLLSLIFLGIISTFAAMVLETVGQDIIGNFLTKDTIAYNLVLYYVVVGLSEEGSKYVLLKYRTWKSRQFNYLFDGVIYAVFVSLGFALWENIAYVGQYGFSTAIVRAVTAVPGHACFGVFMGCYYSYAKRAYNEGKYGKAKSYKLKAFLVPAFIHGTYDFLTTFQSTAATAVFIIFVIVMFIIAYNRINTLSKNDRSIQYRGFDNFYNDESHDKTDSSFDYYENDPNHHR